MKKLALGVATALATLAVAPGVFAAVENLGSVEEAPTNDCMISGETPTPKITPEANAENVTIAYTVDVLKYVTGDGQNGKENNTAWLGIKVTAPDSIKSKDTAEKVGVYIDGVEQPDMSFLSIADNTDKDTGPGPYFSYLYGGVNQAKLEKATKEGKTEMTLASYGFDWDDDGTIDQTFNITVNTTDLTLYGTEGKDGEPLFTPEMATANIEAYEKAQEAANQPETTPEEENANPNTADPVALYATVAVVALVGLGATAVVASKARR